MIIPTGYAQVNLMFTGSALPNGAQVTLGYKLGTGFDDPAILAAGVIAAIDGSDWLANVHVQNVISSVLAKLGPNDTGASAEVPCDIEGTYSSGGCKPNTTFLISKTTAVGGHAGRGRAYWPGVPDNEVENDGTIQGATLVAAQSDLSSLFSDLDSVSDGLYLLHGAGSPVSTPTKITQFLLDARVATQRRRLRG